MLICHLYIFSGEVSVKIFDPLLKTDCFLIVRFWKFLVYFWVKVLHQMVFCKYFLSISGLSFCWCFHFFTYFLTSLFHWKFVSFLSYGKISFQKKKRKKTTRYICLFRLEKITEKLRPFSSLTLVQGREKKDWKEQLVCSSYKIRKQANTWDLQKRRRQN